MWLRQITWPWWIRWLMASLWLIGVAAVLAFPQWQRYPGRFPLVIGAVMLGASLAAAALVATLLARRSAPYAAIITPLDPAQRRELAGVIKPGPLPTDPAVLAAGARLRRLARAEHTVRPAGKWPAVFTVFTAAYGVWMMTRPGTFAFGVAMLLFAAYTAARLLRGRLRARRLTPRWDALIAAAQADPVAHDLLQAANDVPAPRDWRQWARFVAAAAIYGGACGVMVAGIGSTHTTCATAAPVVNYLYDHRDLLDSQHLTDNQPPTSAYRQWAEQLADYAAAGHASALSADLNRVSDIAGRIADTVELIRRAPPTTPETLAETKAPFQSLVTQLIDAEHPLSAACR